MSNTRRHKVAAKIRQENKRWRREAFGNDKPLSRMEYNAMCDESDKKVRELARTLTGSANTGFAAAFGQSSPGVIRGESKRLNRIQRIEVRKAKHDHDYADTLPDKFAARSHAAWNVS